MLVLWIADPWVNAQEDPKPKLQEWQINGILAALNDGYPEVNRRAFWQLRDFDAKELAAFPKQSEEIARRAIDLVNDSQADSYLRIDAAVALGTLDKANASVVHFLTNLVSNSKDYSLRYDAVYALRILGKADASVVKSLMTLVNDKRAESNLRDSAVSALGILGKTDARVMPFLTTIVNDKRAESNLRDSAVSALGILGKTDASVVKSLTTLVNDSKADHALRTSAVEALGELSKADASVVSFLMTLTNNNNQKDTLSYGYVIEALGESSKTDARVLPFLTTLVNDRQVDLYVRSKAVETLGKIGKTDARVLPFLTTLVNDRQVGLYVRSKAVETLGKIGKTNASVVKFLTTLVNDNQVESGLRSEAAVALGYLGKADASVVQLLTTIVNDNLAESDLRDRAVKALGELGNADAKVVKSLTNLINYIQLDPQEDSYFLRKYRVPVEALSKLSKTDARVVQLLTTLFSDSKADNSLRMEIVEALSKLKPLDLGKIFVLIAHIYDVGSDELAYSRFAAYFYGGGVNESKTLLQWIGRPDSNSIPTQLTHDEGKQTLDIFAKAWEPSANFPRIRSDLAQATGKVASMVQWQSDDIVLLEQHYKNLSNAKFNSADSVKAAIDSLAIWKWFNTAKTVMAIHLGFWVALIFLYPKSPTIQALFFWNPWVRKIVGLGYVNALLITVPFLQRRLFAPFQKGLRQAAGLDQFDPTAYFQESRVKRSLWTAGKETEEILPLTAAIPSLKGQMLLQAPSGFGKTMFLRHLIKNSPQRTIVFLTATECAQAKDHDVIQAIQAKLPIAASDPNFLKSLIYSGAVDICIDGLNEINAEAQASIKQFLSSYTKGNIILTTQPLSDKNPPQSAQLYRLLPLDDEQISRFLTSRHPENAILQGTGYHQACEAYLKEVLHPAQPPVDMTAIRRVLSNPMDLDTVAEMLANKERPELFRLQQQLYDRMATDYADHNNGYSFPLKPVAQLAYDMRLSDQNRLPKDQLAQDAIDLMEKHKLLTPKSGSWQFRHDKIWDFFIVQKYLEDPQAAYEELRATERMRDTRLRGVYLQLATELELAIAQALEKALFAYASSTGDHTTSDPFRRQLDSRLQTSAAILS